MTKTKPIRRYAVVMTKDTPDARLRALAHVAELESLGLRPSEVKR